MAATHSDFGGVLTIGRYISADRQGFATIHHGGSWDVGYDDLELPGVARSFVFQIGERARLAAALRKLD